jgi:hypothetical protein
MTLTEAVLLTTKNSQSPFSERTLPEVAQAKEAQVDLTLKTLSRDLEPSLPQEEQEESLDSANNSESWMTTTQDHSISTSSPRL